MINDPSMTWGRWYWPAWFIAFLLALLIPEFYALATNVHNTQSYWVWNELDVQPGVSNNVWTAIHFLAFGLWVVILGWLTFHFFWGWFR